MSDTTTSRSNSEIEINSDSAAFGCLTPKVFALTLSIIPAIGSALGWSRLSIWFLAEIVQRLVEGTDAVAITHTEFARALWPQAKAESGARKMRRMIESLKSDQAMCGFQAVWIEVGKRITSRDGIETHHPTTYRLVDFLAILVAIQEAAIADDLCALPPRQCRARLRILTEKVLRARGYQCVPPRAQARGRTMNNKSGELRLVSAPTVAAEPQMGGRVTKDDVEKRMGDAFEQLFECGQDWMSLGLRLPDFVKKVLIGCEANEIRLREAVKRFNKPSLRVVGTNLNRGAKNDN